MVKKVFYYWLPVIIWAGVIFIFSARPTVRASEIHWQDFIVKKTAHIFVYAVFSLLFYRALRKSGFEMRKAGYYSIFFSTLYGFTDEFHQSFTPGREPTFRDVFFDAFGSILAIYLIWNYLPKLSPKVKDLAKKLEIV